MNKNICVYCSSSNNLEEKYYQFANELGKRIAQEGYNLVYGGTTVGMMGAVAKAVLEQGSQVIGVTPQKIFDFLEHFEKAEVIITEDMRSRKAKMEELSDVFLALPGGFGTFEEIFEMIVAKQLAYHKKAIIFLNFDGFYNPLLNMFDSIYKNGFAKENMKNIYFVANTIDDVFQYLATYTEKDVANKWS